MRRDETSVKVGLSRRYIADTSLLNNFVHSASAHVLDRILQEPVRLSKTVLDVEETLLPDFPLTEPTSEFLRPLYMAGLPGHSDYRKIAPFIQSFALDAGSRWEPVQPSEDELGLAARLSSKTIRSRMRYACPEVSRRKTELDAGEAEAAAIAITRGWTFLTDDQASTDLLQCLYSSVPVLGTCTLLVHATERGILTCEEASELFNSRMVDELGFWATRRAGSSRQRLWLCCDPASCRWE